MGDMVDFKLPKSKKPKIKFPPLDEATRIEYEIKQFLTLRGYYIHYLQIEKTNGKFIVGIALTK